MKLRVTILSSAFLSVVLSSPAQGLPPLGQSSDQKPAPAAAPPPSRLTVEAANADLKTARTANQEKRYADAEALMLRDTAARADMPYLWIELGQADLGEKKYDDAAPDQRRKPDLMAFTSREKGPAQAYTFRTNRQPHRLS
jgi:hypothetical protein